MTTIYHKARVGNLDAVLQWASNEIDINLPDEHERTVLYYAAMCGHEDVVSELLKRGAKVGKNDAASALTNDIRLMLLNGDPAIRPKSKREIAWDQQIQENRGKPEQEGEHEYQLF